MHSLTPCYGLFSAFMLLNSVARWCHTTQFFAKMVSFHMLVCMGVGRNFSRGATSGFFQKFFYGGPKVVKFVFYHSKLRNQHFLLKFSNSCPSSNTNMFVCRKGLCHIIKNLGNFKRFNTIPNREILLNLLRKTKYLTDQLQLCICFSNGNAKSLYFISALATQLASLRTTC